MFQLCISSTSQFWLLKLPLAVTCSSHLNVLTWAPHTHPNLCARERRINCSDRWKTPKQVQGDGLQTPDLLALPKGNAPLELSITKPTPHPELGPDPAFPKGGLSKSNFSSSTEATEELWRQRGLSQGQQAKFPAGHHLLRSGNVSLGSTGRSGREKHLPLFKNTSCTFPFLKTHPWCFKIWNELPKKCPACPLQSHGEPHTLPGVNWNNCH